MRPKLHPEGASVMLSSFGAKRMKPWEARRLESNRCAREHASFSLRPRPVIAEVIDFVNQKKRIGCWYLRGHQKVRVALFAVEAMKTWTA